MEESWDLDHVAVGPGGIFYVSTKSWRGLLRMGVDGRLCKNGQAIDILNQTVAQAMQLRERLAALIGEDVPFVQAVLAAPFAYTDGPTMQGRVLVAHQDNLVEAIEGDGKIRLKKEQLRRCIDALEMLQKTAKHLYRRPKAGKVD